MLMATGNGGKLAWSCRLRSHPHPRRGKTMNAEVHGLMSMPDILLPNLLPSAV
jgi:hypothetical protein